MRIQRGLLSGRAATRRFLMQPRGVFTDLLHKQMGCAAFGGVKCWESLESRFLEDGN